MARIRIRVPGLGRIRNLYSNKSPARRVLMSLGAVSFLAGAALLAFGLVSLFNGGGSDTISGPPIVKVAQVFTPTPVPPTITPSPAVPTPPPAPPLGDAPFRMVIEKIGVNAPVEVFGLNSQQVPEVPTGANAAKIVAWYNFSARPGTGSNAVFAGHVTWFGAAVFYNLTSIAPGDTIKLENDNGTELVYNVSNVFAVDANDPNATQVMYGTPKDVLTIITCDGTFTRNPNDHVAGGSYNQRLVVRADLAKVNAPAAAQSALSGG